MDVVYEWALQTLYTKKLGEGKLEILKDSNEVDRSVLDPVKASKERDSYYMVD